MTQEQQEKYCKKCQTWKFLEDFAKSKGTNDGRYAYCKICARLKTAQWRKQNPTAWREYEERNRETLRAKKRTRYTDPVTRHRTNLRDVHGITRELYLDMLDKQDGVCAICRQASEGVLNVDHDHTTGYIRGLLCGSCNRALGLLQDDTTRLRRAIQYLNNPTVPGGTYATKSRNNKHNHTRRMADGHAASEDVSHHWLLTTSD